MLTHPLLGRLWRTARYRQLMRELLAGRPEADLQLGQRIGGPLAAAALGLLRLGELRQAALPIARELREHVLLCQRRDGGWSEGQPTPLLTALCLRGLASVEGSGANSPARMSFVSAPALRVMRFDADRDGCGTGDVRLPKAIQRGIDFLAAAQSPDGGWGDAFVTGFVLLQLGRMRSFRDAVCISDALGVRRAWPAARVPAEAHVVWSRVEMRCGRLLRRAALHERPALAKTRYEPLFAEVA